MGCQPLSVIAPLIILATSANIGFLLVGEA
jgi:hypothetical protein